MDSFSLFAILKRLRLCQIFTKLFKKYTALKLNHIKEIQRLDLHYLENCFFILIQICHFLLLFIYDSMSNSFSWELINLLKPNPKMCSYWVYSVKNYVIENI